MSPEVGVGWEALCSVLIYPTTLDSRMRKWTSFVHPPSHLLSEPLLSLLANIISIIPLMEAFHLTKNILGSKIATMAFLYICSQ